MKCDEAKPSCTKCVSTGRKCDGYVTTLCSAAPGHGHTQRELLPCFNPGSHSISRTPIGTAHLQTPLNDDDRLAYEYFLRHTAGVIWHVSPAKKWIQVALQLGVQKQTVFYAAAAVGSIHRARTHYYHHTLTEPDVPDEHAGLDQYCKALASLQRFIADAVCNDCDLEQVLLCCLLFVCFEMFQGRGYRALSHLRLGRRLLGGAHKSMATDKDLTTCKRAAQSPAPLEELLDMFGHIEAEVDSAPQAFHAPADHLVHFTTPVITMPIAFASIEMAKESLCRLVAAGARFRQELVERAMSHLTAANNNSRNAVKYCIAHCLSRTIDTRDDSLLYYRATELNQAHNSWLLLFGNMKARIASSASKNLLLMQIQHFFSRITLKTCTGPSEVRMDNFDAEIVRILALIEQYFAATDGLPDVSPTQPLTHPSFDPESQQSFSLESGILPMLYFICLKCRVSDIRYRARDMLRDINRREGLYYSRALADRAADIIQLEETRAREILGTAQGAVDNIPDAARILDVVSESISPMECRVICGRFQHEKDGRLEISEHRRFRKPHIDAEPIWQTVLSYHC